MEVRLEGYDRSELDHRDYSLLLAALTSLEGYRSLRGELSLLTSPHTVDAKAAANWDTLQYQIRTKGITSSQINKNNVLLSWYLQ